MKVCPKSGSLYRQTSEQISRPLLSTAKTGIIIKLSLAPWSTLGAARNYPEWTFTSAQVTFPWSTFSCPIFPAALVNRQHCKQKVWLTQSNSPRALANLGGITQLASKWTLQCDLTITIIAKGFCIKSLAWKSIRHCNDSDDFSAGNKFLLREIRGLVNGQHFTLENSILNSS